MKTGVKQMVLFLDYDGVVNCVMWEFDPTSSKYVSRYGCPKDGKVNNYQAVQWVSELCQKYNIDIVVTSTWRLFDNYQRCLIDGGLRQGIKILGRVSLDNNLSRAAQIHQYLQEHPEIGDQFIIVDDDNVDMSEFGYDRLLHFIQCSTNAGFGYEEFERASSAILKLTA